MQIFWILYVHTEKRKAAADQIRKSHPRFIVANGTKISIHLLENEFSIE